MLTAPIFSPIRKRPPALVKSQSSPSGLDERCRSQGSTPGSPLSRKPTIRRSPSSYTGSLYDEDDLGERLSPAGKTTDWKADLEHWIVKREDYVPPPELGHDGMPRADRRKAIDDALLWLRVEMKRMRDEDNQLKQDFDSLSSEVHSMKMDAEKTQTMLRYRSITSMSSLLEIGSDSDSDQGIVNDFPDSSMVGNISTQSLMGRQNQRKPVSAATPMTPPSLRRQVLTPGPGPVSIRKRKVGKGDRRQLQSTPIKSTPETLYEVPFLPDGTPEVQLPLQRRLELEKETESLASEPSGKQSEQVQSAPQPPNKQYGQVQSTPQPPNKHYEQVQSMPEPLSNRKQNSPAASRSKHDKTVSAPALCLSQQQQSRDMAGPRPKASKPSTSNPTSKVDISEASQRNQTPVATAPRRESFSSREDSLHLLVQAVSPKLKRRVIPGNREKKESTRNTRRGSPMPSLIPKVGVPFNGGSPQATAPAAIASSTPVAIATKPPTSTPSNGTSERASYGPPNISQASSPQFHGGVIPRSQSAQMHQQQEVIAAAASLQSLPQGQGGTLPRARKTHRRTSSSSSVGDSLAFLTATPRIAMAQDMPDNGLETAHARSQSLTVESSSMPLIRDADEEAPFYSRLQGNADFSKFEPGSHDYPVAAGRSPSVRSAAGGRVDRSQPLHKRPQPVATPFFTPTPLTTAHHHGYPEPEFNVPGPVMESPAQHYASTHASPPRSPAPAHRLSPAMHSPPRGAGVAAASQYQNHQHQHQHQQQQFVHVRHHSADYTASLATMKQGSETSPLTGDSDLSNFLGRRASADMVPELRIPSVGSYQPGYGSIGRRAAKRKCSLSLPPSPGIEESTSAPSSPKVSRSHSDVQRRNLAITVALRCAKAAAAAPAASPSLHRLAESGSMFTYPATEEQSLPCGGGLAAGRNEHGSMESLV